MLSRPIQTLIRSSTFLVTKTLRSNIQTFSHKKDVHTFPKRINNGICGTYIDNKNYGAYKEYIDSTLAKKRQDVENLQKDLITTKEKIGVVDDLSNSINIGTLGSVMVAIPSYMFYPSSVGIFMGCGAIGMLGFNSLSQIFFLYENNRLNVNLSNISDKIEYHHTDLLDMRLSHTMFLGDNIDKNIYEDLETSIQKMSKMCGLSLKNVETSDQQVDKNIYKDLETSIQKMALVGRYFNTKMYDHPLKKSETSDQQVDKNSEKSLKLVDTLSTKNSSLASKNISSQNTDISQRRNFSTDISNITYDKNKERDQNTSDRPTLTDEQYLHMLVKFDHIDYYEDPHMFRSHLKNNMIMHNSIPDVKYCPKNYQRVVKKYLKKELKNVNVAMVRSIIGGFATISISMVGFIALTFMCLEFDSVLSPLIFIIGNTSIFICGLSSIGNALDNYLMAKNNKDTIKEYLNIDTLYYKD
jgi:hypothetical protein